MTKICQCQWAPTAKPRTAVRSHVAAPVVEDVVDVLLPSGPGHDGRPVAPTTAPEGRHLTVESVRKVVIEAVVGEALVDGQTHVVEASDFEDGLASIIVESVKGRVADDLKHANDRLVRDVAAGHVVAVESHLLIGTGLSALEVEGRPLHVLLEDIVVQQPTHCRSGAARSSTDFQAADVARDEVVVEKHVLRILDVQVDGGLAGGEVSVQADAVGGNLVPLHGDDGICLPGRRVPHGAALVVLEDRERHVVSQIAIDAHERDGERDDLCHETKVLSCPSGVKLDAHGVGAGRLMEDALAVRAVHLEQEEESLLTPTRVTSRSDRICRTERGRSLNARSACTTTHGCPSTYLPCF